MEMAPARVGRRHRTRASDAGCRYGMASQFHVLHSDALVFDPPPLDHMLVSQTLPSVPLGLAAGSADAPALPQRQTPPEHSNPRSGPLDVFTGTTLEKGRSPSLDTIWMSGPALDDDELKLITMPVPNAALVPLTARSGAMLG